MLRTGVLGTAIHKYGNSLLGEDYVSREAKVLERSEVNPVLQFRRMQKTSERKLRRVVSRVGVFRMRRDASLLEVFGDSAILQG